LFRRIELWCEIQHMQALAMARMAVASTSLLELNELPVEPL
jgi:hypothetical protein